MTTAIKEPVRISPFANAAGTTSPAKASATPAYRRNDSASNLGDLLPSAKPAKSARPPLSEARGGKNDSSLEPESAGKLPFLQAQSIDLMVGGLQRKMAQLRVGMEEAMEVAFRSGHKDKVAAHRRDTLSKQLEGASDLLDALQGLKEGKPFVAMQHAMVLHNTAAALGGAVGAKARRDYRVVAAAMGQSEAVAQHDEASK